MEDLQIKEMKCSICDTLMRYYKNGEYWRCPTCKAELWPDEHRLVELLREKKAKETAEAYRLKLRWSLSRLKIYPEPGSMGGKTGKGKGRNKSGKKRKKPLKRLKPYELL